jgi:HK97 family phage major capsid protein
VDFEHGRDPDEIGNNKDNVLGFVDWKSAEITDDGVIVKRVLNRRHKYMKWLEPLIRAGVIGNSSEAIGGQVVKGDDGEIRKWALRRDTLTVNPMEPRMIADNALAVKALLEDFPQYKSVINFDGSALSDVEDTNKKEVKTMDTNEVNAAVEKAVADALAKRAEIEKAESEKQAALKAAEEKGYAAALEDVRSRKAPAFNTKTQLGFSEEKDAVPAFKHWLATGQENGGLIAPDSSFSKIQDAKAAWNVTTGASGGFLVPDPLYNRIVEKRNLASWVRQAPVQKFTTPADHLLVPRENTSHTAFVLTAEAAAYDENEGTVSQKDLILYKYTKMEKVNEEFLMYQQTNWEEWLSNALGRAEAVTENTIFTTGSGSGQPEGVVTGATNSSLTLASVDVILPSEMTALIGKLGAGYNVPSECGFLMANATKWYLKGSSISGYLVFNQTPTAADFFGYPAFISDDVAPYTTESDKPLIFGNFNYFAIVEKPGMIVQRNPYLYMANGQVGIFASIFRGGGILQAEAFYYINSHS